MTLDLKVLKCGNCEELKLGVHAMALALAALCGAYNTAAWLSRRERHLAINAMLYAALIAFEHQHVTHHFAELRPPLPPPKQAAADTLVEVAPAVAVAVIAVSNVAA